MGWRARGLAVLILLCCGASTRGVAEPVYPGDDWERADPQASGWSTQKLEQARAYFEEIGSTALFIVHDGRVVAAWGDLQRPVKIHSARKSIMSALYGIAVQNREVNLNATLAELGIDDKPPRLTPTEKQATVRELLMARSGIYHNAAAETAKMRSLRPSRGSHPPGTFWYYNNWDFNALGTILRNATREDTFAAVERHFARPLGMRSFTARQGEYVRVDASEHPAYHMYFTAPDLARFGWLFLNQGRWREQQIVSAQWVKESTTAWSPDARPGVGYGYMWWVAMTERQFKVDMGSGSFSARGNGGQYVVVAPARRIVVVHLNDQSENDKLERGEFNKLMQLVFAAAPR